MCMVDAMGSLWCLASGILVQMKSTATAVISVWFYEDSRGTGLRHQVYFCFKPLTHIGFFHPNDSYLIFASLLTHFAKEGVKERIKS